MPILPPSIDDRDFADLVQELVARIPAHTPEWSHPTPGDPGHTMLELFAWLTDTLLYRANLIPERQRLAFLQLLGEPLRPAKAARGIVSVLLDDDGRSRTASMVRGAQVGGPVDFETLGELTVLPVTGEAYYKRPLTTDETDQLGPVVDGLHELYRLSKPARPYVTTPVFAEGVGEPAGLDLVGATVDRALWIALLAPKPELVEPVRTELGSPTPTGVPKRLSIGVAPKITVPGLFEEIGARAAVPHVWEITGVTARDETRYFRMDVDTDRDSTRELTRTGVVRLALPNVEAAPGGVHWIRAPSNDVRNAIDAGVGERPPRLDDQERAARLVAWVRMRPTQRPTELSMSWVGVNAVEVDQRLTVERKVVGVGTGTADQVVRLPGESIEPETLVLQVEEDGRYVEWGQIDDLALAGREDRVFELDPEAGSVRFGDGIRGRAPGEGRRIRVRSMRTGGGEAGNLPPGSLDKIKRASHPDGTPVRAKLRVVQPLATLGGERAETVAEAERRIPALFRDRDRAVTEMDYKRLAGEVSGMGRVELLPRFKPHQRRFDVPGVVSVMTLPSKEGWSPPAPRPDRPFLEHVHAHLDARRPLSTELYVIGCEYVPLGVGVGVSIREGHGRDAVLQAVADSLRTFLWPLSPGGHAGLGWTLGRAVTEREVEVAVARVEGVREVGGLRLFERQGDVWSPILSISDAGAQLALEPWQLPELLSVVVLDAPSAPDDLDGVPDPFADESTIAVPVIPEVC